jgi:hypothetical protein
MVFKMFKRKDETPVVPPVSESEVPSPCNGVCDMDWMDKVCKSCLRTVVEIGHWARMDDEERYAVLDAVAERRQAKS